MSLIEEARTVRQRIAARLRELEPLVHEYEELRRAAAEMGIDAESEPEEPRAAPAPSRTSARASRRGRPQKRAAEKPASDPGDLGDLGARVLDAVESEPGKAVADYARMLGVAPTDLYRPVRELTDDGRIVKRARQLFPG